MCRSDRQATFQSAAKGSCHENLLFLCANRTTVKSRRAQIMEFLVFVQNLGLRSEAESCCGTGFRGLSLRRPLGELATKKWLRYWSVRRGVRWCKDEECPGPAATADQSCAGASGPAFPRSPSPLRPFLQRDKKSLPRWPPSLPGLLRHAQFC